MSSKPLEYSIIFCKIIYLLTLLILSPNFPISQSLWKTQPFSLAVLSECPGWESGQAVGEFTRSVFQMSQGDLGENGSRRARHSAGHMTTVGHWLRRGPHDLDEKGSRRAWHSTSHVITVGHWLSRAPMYSHGNKQTNQKKNSGQCTCPNINVENTVWCLRKQSSQFNYQHPAPPLSAKEWGTEKESNPVWVSSGWSSLIIWAQWYALLWKF